MLRNRKYQLIIALIFGVIAISFYTYQKRKVRNYINSLNSEFTLLRKGDSIRGQVSFILGPAPELVREDPAYPFIELNKNEKVRFLTSKDLEGNVYISDVLRLGDSLFLKGDSDLVVLKRYLDIDTIVYKFRIYNPTD